jgi:acetyl esterase/lipase
MIKKLSLVAAIVALEIVGVAAATEAAHDVIRDRVYVERESGPLKVDLYIPHEVGPFPAVLVVHGGAWVSGTKDQLALAARYLADHGYVAAAISYRLAPASTFPAQIYDCQAAVRWLRGHANEFKIDSTRIGGYGYSAGGHLVALLGALDDKQLREPGVPADAPSARLQCVVAGGAPCEFRVLPKNSDRLAYWLGGTPGEKPDAYRDSSPANFVTSDDPPMFFFHGSDDSLVKSISPEWMVSRLKALNIPTEFHMVSGAGHIQAARDRESLELATAFADRILKGEKKGEAGAVVKTAGGGDASVRAQADTTASGGAADGK